MTESQDAQKHLQRCGAVWSLCRQGEGTLYWPDTQGPQDCHTCWIIRRKLQPVTIPSTTGR
jgi:hypothetical protein